MTQAGKARVRANPQPTPAADEEQSGSRSVRRALEMFEFLLQQGEITGKALKSTLSEVRPVGGKPAND